MKRNENDDHAKLLRSVADFTADIIPVLYKRCQERKRIDNFAEYALTIQEKVKQIPGIIFLKATKHPFGFRFRTQLGDFQYSFTIEGNCKLTGIHRIFSLYSLFRLAN